MSDLPKFSRRYGEYIGTAAALVISFISLWVAVGTEDANNKMVAAASWPFLQLDSGNTDNGKQVISLAVVNSGVGPAKIESFEVFWHARSFRTSQQLMTLCSGLKYTAWTGPGVFLGPSTQPVKGFVVRAGETRAFFSMPLAPQNAAAWRKFDGIRLRELSLRACYCSVFDECWISNLRDLHPMRVNTCPVPKVAYSE